MNESIQIEVPLPPVECSPNGRYHWARKAAAVKTYRAQCAAAFRAVGAVEPPVVLSLDFYCARPRTVVERIARAGRYYPRDAANATASFKAGQDALVDAGVVKSDSHRYVVQGPTRLHTTAREHKGRACVVVTIERGA